MLMSLVKTRLYTVELAMGHWIGVLEVAMQAVAESHLYYLLLSFTL